jgi:sugar phosphate isomerase/epimerase
MDGYKEMAERLYPIGEQCKKNNIRLVYHHHEWELVKDGGRDGLELMTEMIPPDLLGFQAEVFWLESAGVDPLEFIKKYKDRMVSLHVGDKKNKTENIYVDLGRGIIDYKPIFALCKSIGVEWYNVEQENYEGDFFESLEHDCNYLKQNL